ncbi:aminotransferase class V-fold PLP-dependent enzyme [Paenibacillus sp.]|uniref:aminotransferase class I/II-fold pyridoxal phosphate-dependent enzyme n=1 Tax=Paenibacillus sp. TaxID=58172 RepID=UPI0028112396|nr:aminotransferase class V-fold PLP-dependent enzyme [Paenibacillus sp.]
MTDKRTLQPGDAPIVAALAAYRSRRRAGFHVPGHKAGAAYASDPDVASWLGAVGPYDATELPGLDDLHAPSGAIEQAQALAAQCFGARRTYFLVGGSTVGNLAAIHAAAGPGELLVLQRDAHKSAIHALMLRGAGAVFVLPEADEELGLYGGVSADAIARALDEHPEAKAVFVTSPNYYGIAADIGAIAEAAHARGKALIVDEAHGAHFGRHPRFPKSALQQGADVVIQSTHKMLSALTMGAMLHIGSNRIPHERIEAYLRMLQSSSPSYLILASLDRARRELHTRGDALFAEALEAIDSLGAALRTTTSGRFGVKTTSDPFKPLLYDAAGGWTGYELAERLAEVGIYTEMANESYVVLACSAATSAAEIERLLSALQQFASRFPAKKKENQQNFSNMYALGALSLSAPVYFKAEDAISAARTDVRQDIPWEEAVGETCAEMVIPYPPGIPILLPGEEITRDIAAAALRLREQGASVQGVRDPSLRMIGVRKEP